jgi:hypothetical protein
MLLKRFGAAPFARLMLKLALVLGPTLCVAGVTEHRLETIPDSYVQKRDLLAADASKVQVLILGSSHTYYGLIPTHMPGHAFNLAHVSQSVEYDCKMVDKYLDTLPQLQTVVIPVSYFSLRTRLEEGAESWRCFFYERAYGIPSDFGFWYPQHYTRLALFAPQESLQMALDPTTARISADRFDAQGGVVSAIKNQRLSEADGIARVAEDDRSMKATDVQANVARLDATLQTLDRHHIQTVLLTTPVHATFYRHTQPRFTDEVTREATGVAARHHATYLDLFKDARFTDADFQNADHLNKSGALKLTKLVSDTLLRQDKHQLAHLTP